MPNWLRWPLVAHKVAHVNSNSIRVSGARSCLTCIAILAALGLAATIATGSVIALTPTGRGRLAWWHVAKLLASMVTWPQWLELLAWAVLTGVLVAAGARRHRFRSLLALAALIAGALVPVGLVILAKALVRIWPGTTGPMDEPVLTLLLLAYSLVVPWTLGRIITILT
jgi:hypothetical protein